MERKSIIENNEYLINSINNIEKKTGFYFRNLLYKRVNKRAVLIENISYKLTGYEEKD